MTVETSREVQFCGYAFRLHYDGRSVVTITRCNVPDLEFDACLNRAEMLRARFPRTSPGSDWGCDGVGYAAQRNLGQVYVHRSGVGPRKFAAALAALPPVYPVAEVARAKA